MLHQNATDLGWARLSRWLSADSHELLLDAGVSDFPDASALAAVNGTRYFFYSPEMNLLAETEIRTTPGAPALLYEYVWFNGAPVAQIDGGTATRWTFTDHLGTPLIQTDAAGTVVWRAEYEPYGRVYVLRTADQHQPLRLPGQEAEQLNLGANGDTERSYNIFRWYRSAWGRYTQSDPIGMGGSGDANLYRYALDNPLLLTDPDGLKAEVCCRPLAGPLFVFNSFDHHCFIRGYTRNNVPVTYSLFPDESRRRGFTRINDVADSGAGNVQCETTECGDIDCVARATRAYPSGGRYKMIGGPNSNTFAAYVARKCDLNLPLFANSTTASGWDATPPLGAR